MNESTLPAVVPVSGPVAAVPSAASRLLAAFLSGRSQQTLRAYRADLEDFAASLGLAYEEAVGSLLGHGAGHANEVAMNYKAGLMERNLAAATVNRRLAALRSIIKMARTLGIVNWTLEVAGQKSEPYRDTTGPGTVGVRSILSLAAARNDGKGIRDAALVRLAYDLGLRRKEIVGLNLEDVDLAGGTVAVLGKGRTQLVKMSLPDPTKAALAAWVHVRGTESGPLFTNFDRASKGDGRLTGSAVYAIIVALGNRLGIKTRPHGLRHSAITEVLELTGGDVRSAAKFSRHRDLRVLCKYDDSRVDVGGDLAKRLAGGL